MGEIPAQTDFAQFWVKIRNPKNGRIIGTQIDEGSFKTQFGNDAAGIFSKWVDLKVRFDIHTDSDDIQTMIDDLRTFEQNLKAIRPELNAEEIYNAREKATRIRDL